MVNDAAEALVGLLTLGLGLMALGITLYVGFAFPPGDVVDGEVLWTVVAVGVGLAAVGALVGVRGWRGMQDAE